MQGLLMKFGGWGCATSISHVLVIHTSWHMKMCLVAEEHKSAMRQIFCNGFRCPFCSTANLYGWNFRSHSAIRAAAYLCTDRLGDFNNPFRTLSTFSWVLVNLEGPGLFFTHWTTDFRTGTQSADAIVNGFLNARWVAIIDRPLEKSP